MTSVNELTRDSIEKPTGWLFFRYSILTVIGMIAVSSASVVDAVFIGKFVGEKALASMNLSLPYFSFIFGIGLMISIGTSVTAGKLRGEGKDVDANRIFTGGLLAVFLFSVLSIVLVNLFPEKLSELLGGKSDTASGLQEYIRYLTFFIPLFLTSIYFMFYVRLSGGVVQATVAMSAAAMLNVFLDFIFIAKLGMGIKGAAIGTGLSTLASLVFYLNYFHKTVHSFRLEINNVFSIGFFRSIANGVSEFTNEISAGVTTWIFNTVMLDAYGTSGVASYGIVTYITWTGLMITYGISDSLQPLLSINYGAGKNKRIKSFLLYGFISALVTGIAITCLVVLFPEVITRVFLNRESDVLKISKEFLTYYWPAFILSGMNIIFTVYFTSLQKIYRSAAIAVLRSLVLPAFFILSLPIVFGNKGIFIAIPFTELVTLFIALILFRNVIPDRLSAEVFTQTQ